MSRRTRDARLKARKESARTFARFGVLLEDRVEQLLAAMKSEGLIAAFVRHPHFSPSDLRGKDFTAVKLVGERRVAKSFGVTVSPRSSLRSNTKHPRIPTWWFPEGTSDERIRNRILTLFDDPRFD